MRAVFLPVFFLITLGLSTSILAEDFDFIDHVQKQYAPDRREAVFDVSAESKDDRLILTGETSLPEAHKALLEAAEADSDKEIVDHVKVLPEASLGEKTWALINLSVANLRTEPRYAAEMATQATLGTPVRVLKKQGRWYLVQMPDRYLGWVDPYGIARKTSAEMEAWRRAARVIYLGDTGVVYRRADKSPEPLPDQPKVAPRVVTDIVLGDIVETRGAVDNGMVPVALPDGRKGYVSSSLLIDFDRWCEKFSPTRESLVNLGSLFLGRPYLWGGTSPKGIDCSGLVKIVYFNRGIILPRDASQIRRYGESIDLEDAKPGDLLFWGFKAKNGQKERTTHIGLYLGEKQILHSSGRVRLGHIDPTKLGYFSYSPGCLLDVRNVTDHIGTPGIVRVKDHPWYTDQND